MINYVISFTFILIAMIFDLKIKRLPNLLFIIFLLFGIGYFILYSKISFYFILSLIAMFGFYFLEYISVPEMKILLVLSLLIRSVFSFIFFYKIAAFILVFIYAIYALKKKKIKNPFKFILEPISKLKRDFVIDLMLYTSIFVILLFYFKLPFVYITVVFTLLPLIFCKVGKKLRIVLTAIALPFAIFFINFNLIYFVLAALFGLVFFPLIFLLPRFFKAILYNLTEKLPVSKLQEGMYLSRAYTVLKNKSLVSEKDLFKDVVDGFNEKNFLFSSIGNTVKHFTRKKDIYGMISMSLDKRKIEKLKYISKQKKLKFAEVYTPANKILNYLSLTIALLIEIFGIILI